MGHDSNSDVAQIDPPSDVPFVCREATSPGGRHTTDLFVFLHIAKTGGTTLAEILSRQFPPEVCFNAHLAPSMSALGIFPEAPIARTLSEMPAEALQRIRFVGGHLMFGVHRHFGRNATYLTMLREPVDRVVSSYHYIQGQPGIPVGRVIRENGLTVDQYARSGLGLDPHNYQIRILAGLRELDSDWDHTRETVTKPLNRDVLELAKKNLLEHCPVIGLTERFDESLALMALEFGWKPSTLAYVRRNETPGRDSVEDVPQSALDVLRECNRWDIELYAFAQERLATQWAAAGPEAIEMLTLLRESRGLGVGSTT